MSTIKREMCFTLIELLVVISIIAILASMLLPVLNQARGKARMTSCSTKLKTLGTMINMYCDDYNSHMPYSSLKVNSDGLVMGNYMEKAKGPPAYLLIEAGYYGKTDMSDRETYQDVVEKNFRCPSDQGDPDGTKQKGFYRKYASWDTNVSYSFMIIDDMLIKRWYHPDGVNAEGKLGRDRQNGANVSPGNFIAADSFPYTRTGYARNHKSINVLALGGHVTIRNYLADTSWSTTDKSERMRFMDHMDGRL